MSVLTTALFLLFAGPVLGQKKTIYFQSESEGLSQLSVNHVEQDHLGFLWVATQDGLNRFDGRGFVVFKHDPDDPTTLAHNHVWQTLASREGDLWVATDGGGLQLWRRNTGLFENFAGALPSRRIRAINECGERLFIGGESGLVSYPLVSNARSELEAFASGDHSTSRQGGVDLRDGVLHSANPSPTAGLSSGEELVDDRVLSLLCEDDAQLWVGMFAGLQRLSMAPGGQSVVVDLGEIEATHRVRGMDLDDRGALWLATYSGLVRVDTETLAFTAYRHAAEDPRSLAADIVRAVLVDSDGRVWAGTADGLDYFEPEVAKASHYARASNQEGSLRNQRILSLFQDEGGVIWVGTQGGLHHWHPDTWAFGHYQSDPDNPDSLASDTVTSISEDASGDLWVGTLGGLDRFDRTTGGVEHYSAGTKGLTDRRVTSLMHQEDGGFWVGTYRGGVHYQPPGEDRFQVFQHDPNDDTTLAVNAVTTIHEGSSGEVWIGTFGGGLHRHLGEGVMRRYEEGTSGLRSAKITALSTGLDDDLWVGTDGGGLHLLDRQSERLIPIEARDGAVVSAPETVFSIAWVGGELWLGTNGEGLMRLDGLDRERGIASFVRYTERHGLPNNVIYGVRGDSQNNLWMSTNRGLSQRHHETGEFRNFDPSHGLQDEEFNHGAHFMSTSGELFFGGMNGLNAFRPEALPTNTHAPRVVLTAFTKFNQPVDLDISPDQLERVVLDHKDDIVSFEFAALDFKSPERNRFRYKLTGFNDQWIDLGLRDRVTFTTLDPGDYTLLVEAANNDGVWSQQPFSLDISVLPAPWLTWWAYTLYAFLLTGLIFLALRLRWNQLRARERELERQVKERTGELSRAVERLQISEHDAQIAKDEATQANRAKSLFLSSMSHELRTPLNAVLGFSQLMRRDPALPERMRSPLGVISRSGEHLLGLINDVLSLSKVEAGQVELELSTFDFSALLNGVEGMMRVRADRRSVVLKVPPPADFPRVVVGDQKKLRQVLINLVGNAIKFTEAQGRVDVRCRWREHRAEIEIQDTGRGIASAEFDRLFKPFVQTASGIEAGEGTGLGLAISREFVELMGGEINVDSAQGVGSTFTVTVDMPSADAEELRGERRVDCLQDGEPAYRVMIAEDMADHRLLLAELLRSVGFDVKEAANGREALEHWCDWRPHAVLSDLEMPVMGGQELIRRIREGESEAEDHRTVIVALTATVFDNERQALLELGADDFLPKPFRDEDLFDVLGRHLGAEYRYSTMDDHILPADIAPKPTLDAEIARRSVPAPLRAQLREALDIGDVVAAADLVEHADGVPVDVKAAIDHRLRRYEIDQLLEVLQ